MARVVAFVPDLLFGSRVVESLPGHEVELTSDPGEDADLLIVDLTADPEERIARVRTLRVPKLGFYSHVEADVRTLAEEAGFDLVVPRSRMAREGPALVERLLGGG
jgi:hypothetical protein